MEISVKTRVGKDNPEEVTGLLTDEIKEQFITVIINNQEINNF